MRSTTRSSSCSSAARAARAGQCDLTPTGSPRPEQGDLHHLPGEDKSGTCGASEITLDTKSKIGTGRGAKSTSRACRSCTCRGCPFRSATSARAASCSRASATPPAAACSSRCRTTGTSRRTWTSPFEPTEYTRRGIDLGGDLRFMTASQHGELDWNFLPCDSTSAPERQRRRGLRRQPQPRASHDVTELPDDFRLTVEGGERQRHALLPGLLPGSGGHQHGLPRAPATLLLSRRALARGCAGRSSTRPSTSSTCSSTSGPMRACRASSPTGDLSYGESLVTALWL